MPSPVVLPEPEPREKPSSSLSLERALECALPGEPEREYGHGQELSYHEHSLGYGEQSSQEAPSADQEAILHEYERVLEYAEIFYGADDSHTVALLNDLAKLYEFKGTFGNRPLLTQTLYDVEFTPKKSRFSIKLLNASSDLPTEYRKRLASPRGALGKREFYFEITKCIELEASFEGGGNFENFLANNGLLEESFEIEFLLSINKSRDGRGIRRSESRIVPVAFYESGAVRTIGSDVTPVGETFGERFKVLIKDPLMFLDPGQEQEDNNISGFNTKVDIVFIFV